MRLAMALFLTATVTASLGTAADAATLRPNGKYAFTQTEQCEAKFTFAFGRYLTSTSTSSNAVRIINSVGNGSIGASVGYITFTPTTSSGGNFSMSLTDVDGGALRINNGGVNVTTKLQGASGAYTFATSSLTLTPKGQSAMTFTMVYGALNAAGAPASVHLVRQSASGETANCVQEITATK